VTLLILLLVQFPAAREQFMRTAVWLIRHNILHSSHKGLPISPSGSWVGPSCSRAANLHWKCKNFFCASARADAL